MVYTHVEENQRVLSPKKEYANSKQASQRPADHTLKHNIRRWFWSPWGRCCLEPGCNKRKNKNKGMDAFERYIFVYIQVCVFVCVQSTLNIQFSKFFFLPFAIATKDWATGRGSITNINPFTHSRNLVINLASSLPHAYRHSNPGDSASLISEIYLLLWIPIFVWVCNTFCMAKAIASYLSLLFLVCVPPILSSCCSQSDFPHPITLRHQMSPNCPLAEE